MTYPVLEYRVSPRLAVSTAPEALVNVASVPSPDRRSLVFRTMMTRIYSFKQSAEGWDGPGSLAVTDATLESAAQLASMLDLHVRPLVGLSRDGAVVFEWNAEDDRWISADVKDREVLLHLEEGGQALYSRLPVGVAGDVISAHLHPKS